MEYIFTILMLFFLPLSAKIGCFFYIVYNNKLQKSDFELCPDCTRYGPNSAQNWKISFSHVHRHKHMVQQSGHVVMAIWAGVPQTARGWVKWGDGMCHVIIRP